MRLTDKKNIAILFSLIAGLFLWHPNLAQSAEEPRAVDLIIVIDNSCSMFPKEKIIAGCTTWGSDPDYLRIIGADLFIARLGFAQENEADYQVGVIDLGDTPSLVSPLRPSLDGRDALAERIADPIARSATRLVPALELAYQELRNSSNRKDSNLPAIVLITDGVPWPPEGQSNSVIEALINQNTDIPLFLMLLKGVGERSEGYEQYINFWQQLQLKNNHVFVYLIEDAEQIEDTYNLIVSQLQDTIPTKGQMLTPEVPLQVFVSEYVQRVIITVIHEFSDSKGVTSIIDPEGNVVLDSDPGVAHFRGNANPVEVISLAPPRLSDKFKEREWIVKSSEEVNVFIDWQGAYHINILDPLVTPGELSNIFEVKERQNSSTEMLLRFNLLMLDGTVITTPQKIAGEVVYPDGTLDLLRMPTDLRPDSAGVYELLIDFKNLYPNLNNLSGRMSLTIEAGAANAIGIQQLPISSALLQVDIAPGPVIQSINPTKIECIPGQSSIFKVTIGNYQYAQPGTLIAKITTEYGEIPLQPGASGVYSADLASICTSLIDNQACSTQGQDNFKLNITAQLTGQTSKIRLEKDIPVQTFAPACILPTPPEAILLIPTVMPTPVPVPDTDFDGLLDPEDACPVVSGWKIFSGCLPPGWLLGIGIGVTVTAFLAGVIFGLPWLKTKTFAKPPEGYILACKRGKVLHEIVDIQEIGKQRRTNKVTLGGDPNKAHIYVPGLRPVELVVMVQGGKVVLADAKSGNVREVFGSLSVRQVSTSNPEVMVAIGLNRSLIEKWSCK